MKFNKYLRSIGANQPIIDWAGENTLQETWAKNTHPQFAILLIAHVDIQAAVRLAAKFARRVLHMAGDGRAACENAITLAEKWVDDPTDENKDAARAAALEVWAVVASVWATGAADAAAAGAAWAAEAAVGTAEAAAGTEWAAATATRVAEFAAWAEKAEAGAAETQWQMEQIREAFPTIKIEGVE